MERVSVALVTAALDLGASATLGVASRIQLENAHETAEKIVGVSFGAAAVCFLGASVLSLVHARESTPDSLDPNSVSNPEDH